MRLLDEKTFLQIVAATPLVSIDLVIRNEVGEILLGRRTNRPALGFWFVPGGRIRKNERVRDAFSRIAQSELGVPIGLDQAELRGVYDHIYEVQDNFAGAPDVNTHYVCLGFECALQRPTVILSDSQHSDIRWWTKKALLDSPEVHRYTKLHFQEAATT